MTNNTVNYACNKLVDYCITKYNKVNDKSNNEEISIYTKETLKDLKVAMGIINNVYGVIPEGEDEEGQAYSADYIESMYNSGIPMTRVQIGYLNLHRLYEALDKRIKLIAN
jgi:hypothetical protein